MADRLTELSYPAPRALRDLRGIRRELVHLYREAKSGLIEPPLFGRLVNCLNVLQALDNGRIVDERLSELEGTIAAIKKANGDGRRARV